MIAVGDEGQGGHVRRAVRGAHAVPGWGRAGCRCPVFVLHHHQHIACRQFLFTSEHPVADALVEDVGPFVGAGDDHRLIGSHLRIAGCEALDEFVAGDNGDVGESVEAYLRQPCRLMVGDHLPDEGGVVEDARSASLSEHLVQVARIDRQSVGLQHVCPQGRTLLLADRRQLCLVARQQQAAVAPVVDILDEVVQQAAAAEDRVACRLADHRSFVHHEQPVAEEVDVQVELSVQTCKALLTVDCPVDGGSRPAGIQREYFCSAAGRCQQRDS